MNRILFLHELVGMMGAYANLFCLAGGDKLPAGLRHVAASTSIAVVSSSLRVLSRKRRQSPNVERKIQPRAQSNRRTMANRRQRRTHLQLDHERPERARQHARVFRQTQGK